jgi:hypothetical protein
MIALADLAIGLFILACAAFICMIAAALYKDISKKD